MVMSSDLIIAETASTLIICMILIASQFFIARILLKNLFLRLEVLDSNLAEAIQTTVESLSGGIGGENQPGIPPGMQVLMSILKDAKKPDLQRADDGKFKVIELEEDKSPAENVDTSS